MFSARATRAAAQRVARPQSIRNPFQRRFASSESTFTGAENNAFNRERQAVKDHAAATSDLWRKLSIYATIPCLIIASVNAKILWDEHWAHWDHMEPLEERPEYPYQNMRTKNFFWGDGDKRDSWNEKVNYHKKE
ncbi:cytochrome c oxidase subunit [Botrytis cinerea]